MSSDALPGLVRKTKILTTIGPATDRADRLEALLRAGADAFRLNFSHGSDEEHRATLRRMHRAARRVGREVAVVADVPGPKIRIGEVAGGSVDLQTGRRWTLDANPEAGSRLRVGIQIPSFVGVARRGDPLLLGDGDVELVVERATSRAIVAKVVAGGPVTSNAGLFLPRARLRTSVFARKDRNDAAIGLAEGIDFLALSFVRRGRDLKEARRWLDARPRGGRVGLIAKIERAEALGAIDEILEAADGIMIARGDLGIEVPLERLALEQKMLVRRANVAGKFVIVATQMLLSMLHAPRPTRAEATDVANAVLDGADAVMLSEESAVGQYPTQAVQWLHRIASATEDAFDPGHLRDLPGPGGTSASERSVASAAVQLADGVGARAIVTPTHSGRTARLVAALRPTCPVVALSGASAVRRKLALVRGVYAYPSPIHRDLVDLRRAAVELVRKAEAPGDGPIVLTAGYPVEGRPTNLVTLVDPTTEDLPSVGAPSRPRV